MEIVAKMEWGVAKYLIAMRYRSTTPGGGGALPL